MIHNYITENGAMQSLTSPAKGCWISVTAPTAQEQVWLKESLHLNPAFIQASLDPEETSRIDQEGSQTLVIVDYPGQTGTDGSFVTQPVGVILCPDWIVTICQTCPQWLLDMEQEKTAGLCTSMQTRFLLLLLMEISRQYVLCLRQIEKASTQATARLYRGMKNKELLNMLELDKSLIYFSISLKSEEMTLQKISRGRVIPFYPDDTDLMEDVLTEYRQAAEMCTIYSSINSQTMDGFSNFINNAINDTMKRLTIITIVMSIPNMIYGFYGMNVSGLPVPYMWFPLVISIAGCIFCWFYFEHNHKY